jgi:fructosamine-3-kinase
VGGDYVKRVCGGSPGATAWEAAGLSWLAEAEATGGARVVRVLEVTEGSLTLQRLDPSRPLDSHLEDFGRALARTHDAGAPAFGSGPPGWSGDGYLGPASELLPLPLTEQRAWGEFYGESRLRHTLHMAQARGLWTDVATASLFERVCDRLSAGDHDDDQRPARLHGDLWSGNVVWTRDGGVLIDPAAHGGHRLTDLAMLLLFGGREEERVVAAYDEVSPLPDGWRERIGLHQLHPVMMHAVLFGGGYIGQAERMAARCR